MNITGHIITSAHQSTRYPKLFITLIRPGQADLRWEVDVDERGAFQYKDNVRKCTGYTLRFDVPANHNFHPCSKSVQAHSEDLEVELVLEPIATTGGATTTTNQRWPELLMRFLKFLQRKPVAVTIAAITLMGLVVLGITCRPLPDGPMEVSVTVRGPNTNHTLVLKSQHRVRIVSVSINDEPAREFRNTSPRSPRFVIEDESLRTLGDLRLVVTRIDAEEPVVHRLMSIPAALVAAATLHLKESLVATERMSVAQIQIETQGASSRPDKQLIGRAKDSLDYWKREYTAQLKEITKVPKEVLAEALNAFRAGGPMAPHEKLLDTMQPTILDHLQRLKTKGDLPQDFEKNILQRYRLLDNALQPK